MDWITFFIFTTTATTLSLIWRDLLIDHPQIRKGAQNLPILGSALVCGFCFPLWITFFLVLFENPLGLWATQILKEFSFFGFFFGWFSVGAGVLLLRFAIVSLMDGSAILSHKHQESHRKNSE